MQKGHREKNQDNCNSIINKIQLKRKKKVSLVCELTSQLPSATDSLLESTPCPWIAMKVGKLKNEERD